MDETDSVSDDDPGAAAATPSDERVEDLPEVADRVLFVVDQVPPGRVVTYGDIGVVVGVGPRQVGSVMSHYGSLTCWWRVLRADGRPPVCHEATALAHYAEEGTPLRGERVDLGTARVPRDQLRAP